VLPGVYGFAWDTGHVVFLGVFYAVVTVVLSTVAVASTRAARDFRAGAADRIRWQAEFAELSPVARRCRHELAGELAGRMCANGFDCRTCPVHAQMAAAGQAGSAEGPLVAAVGGVDVPADRLYHRGHAWVRLAEEGTAEVGLDDLATRVVGVPDSVELPEVGSHLCVGGTGWRVSRRGVVARVLSPVDGTVIERGGPGNTFLLRVRLDGDASTRHLLAGAEARAWMLREEERLQLALSPPSVGAVLADGGTLVRDLAGAVTPGELETACAEVFLEA
jgi:hypothetical protein